MKNRPFRVKILAFASITLILSPIEKTNLVPLSLSVFFQRKDSHPVANLQF